MPKANLPEDPPILPPEGTPIEADAPEAIPSPTPEPVPAPELEPPAIAPVIQVAKPRPPMQRYTGRIFDRRGNELTPEQIRKLLGGN